MSKSGKERKKVLDSLIATICETKAHGVSNIIRSESIVLKLIWIACFTTSAIYCIYQIITTIITFLSFSVVDSTLVIYESPAHFPAFVLCNLNAYDGNTARNITQKILNENRFSNETTNISIDFVENASEILKANLDQQAINGEFDQWYNGFQLEQMMISCKFYGKKCGLNDFYYFHDYDYGSCYKFNGGLVNKAGYLNESEKIEIKKVNKAGPKNGLRLELFTGNTKLQQQYSYKNGIRAVVHNQSRIPIISSEGIDVPTGLVTNIAISRTFIKHLPAPYSTKCLDSKNINWFENNVLSFMKESLEIESYTQNYCMMTCFQQYLIDKCQCYDLRFPIKETNLRSCVNVNDFKCLINNTDLYYSSGQDGICYSKCPIECLEVVYDLKTNQAKYPSEWYSQLLLNNSFFLNLVVNNSGPNETKLPYPTMGSLSWNTLMVNLYYDEMNYYYIMEEPTMSFEIMLACIGGNMGLFLGCSILFLVELFELFFHVFYFAVLKKF